MLIELAADPVYTAIRKHNAAIAAFNNYRGDEDQHRRLEADMFAAQDEYWAAVPRTLEGFKAKVATFVRFECDGEDTGLSGSMTISSASRSPKFVLPTTRSTELAGRLEITHQRPSYAVESVRPGCSAWVRL